MTSPRRFRPALLSLLLAAATLAGCGGIDTTPYDAPGIAPESNAAFLERLRLEEAVREDARLRTVSSNLLRHALPLCPHRETGFLGLAVAYADDFEPALRAAARRVYGFNDDRPRVLYAVAGSPAARAGLRAGDVIAGIRGGKLTPLRGATRGLRPVGGARRPVVVSVQRGGRTYDVRLTPAVRCDVVVDTVDAGKVNAWADSSGVRISQGMLRFAHSDAELAMVVGHELSHVLLDHAGAFLGFTVTRQRLEEQADRTGLYLMARAGYSPGDGVEILRRMAVTFDDIENTTTHPPMRVRFRLIEKTLKEIAARERTGKPLLPTF